MSAKASSFADEILVAAAARKRGGVHCWTCLSVPPKMLEQIHEAKDRGASVAAIIDWLQGRPEFPAGTVSDASVHNHFRNKHHRPSA